MKLDVHYRVHFNPQLFADIDECNAVGGLDGHHCHGNAECINTVGSYLCHCPPGYEHLDPYTCTGMSCRFVYFFILLRR